jgi:hypothetical protein
MPLIPGMLRTDARAQRAPGPLALLHALLRVLPRLPDMVRTTLAYLRRATPVHKTFVDRGDAPPAPDGDRPLPGPEEALLRRGHGRGPLYRRVYEATISDPRLGPEELITRLLVDPNRASPTEVSVFEAEGRSRDVGAQFAVRMPGPWDAPVRVVERTATTFRFATLRGHMEAGEIGFAAEWGKGGRLVFRIESWARSADRLYDLVYDRIPLTREMQLHMWVTVCEQAARMAGGRLEDGVHVTTERWRSGG